MLAELRRTNTALNIEILGVNQIGDTAANPSATAGRSLPWLQDTVQESAWTKWGVVYRDVRILDGQNQLVAVYNLTQHDLSVASSRVELKRLFLEAAKLIDTDADSLPDDWEMVHFGDLTAQPADDPDHDGSPNSAEFAFGTNPTDESSSKSLTISRPRAGTGATTIKFLRRAGGLPSYTVETSPNLMEWHPANPETMTVTAIRNLFDGTGTSEVVYSVSGLGISDVHNSVRLRANWP